MSGTRFISISPCPEIGTPDFRPIQGSSPGRTTEEGNWRNSIPGAKEDIGEFAREPRAGLLRGNEACATWRATLLWYLRARGSSERFSSRPRASGSLVKGLYEVPNSGDERNGRIR